jgi:hypothetical protein
MVPTGQVFDSRLACMAEEKNQIIRYKPIFNDQHNSDPEKEYKRKIWKIMNCSEQQCQ